jgi:hypothetical protein
MTPYANIDAYDTSEHVWSYVYLHGAAEDAMAYHYQVQNITTAPDIFGADAPKPVEEGNYLVSVLDRPALAVIAIHHGILGGRVALLSDTEGLAHALDVKSWA